MTSLDDPALDALVAQAKHDPDIDGEQLAAVVDELRARRIQATAEARLRTNYTALMALVRSEALGGGELDRALREIAETAARILAVARVSVWRFDEDLARLVCIERYLVADDTHESGDELARTQAPAYFDAVLERRIIAAHDAPTDPRTAELARVDSGAQVRARLVAPVSIDGRPFGAICGEHVGAARNWSTHDEQFASALADFTVLALESHQRFQTKERLREAVDVAKQRLQTIERQRLAIADLSAPVIDVWDGILAVPIVGIVDTQRSIDLTERLLDRIASSHARSVIVDLTGVDIIDTMTADHLLQMLRAAQLLGATVWSAASAHRSLRRWSSSAST